LTFRTGEPLESPRFANRLDQHDNGLDWREPAAGRPLLAHQWAGGNFGLKPGRRHWTYPMAMAGVPNDKFRCSPARDTPILQRAKMLILQELETPRLNVVTLNPRR